MINSVFVVFLIVQTIILIGLLLINIKMVKQIEKVRGINNLPSLPNQQPITLKNNTIPPLSIQSINLKDVVTINEQEEQSYIIAFVSSSCTACKDLFSKTEINQHAKKKLVVVTDDTQNLEFYESILTKKGIPIIESKGLEDHLGIRAFPTVLHVEKNLKVKEFFIGSNYVKFSEYILSA